MSEWKRTFWVIWIANAITAVGMLSFLPFFPGYLERELGIVGDDAIAAWTGVIYGAAPLAAAFSSPLWGALGDRVGRKLMVLRAMAAIALFVGCMGLVTSPWQLLGLRLLQGSTSGFIPPSITMVSVAAPPERQGGIAGSLQSALAAGAIVGPLLGAAIEARFGHRTVFAVVSALAFASFLLVLVFAREDQEGRRQGAGAGRTGEPGLLRGVLLDLADLLRSRRLRSAVVLLFVIQFGVGATNPLLELFVRDLWKGDPERVGFLTAALFTLLALTTLVALPLWGWLGDRFGHRLALLVAAGGTAGALVLHALVPTYLLLWPARVLLGGTASGAGPCTFGIAAEETSPERRGGAFGAVFAARALAISTSAIAGGWLCSLVGVRGLFGLVACLVVVSLGLSTIPGGSGRETPTR